MENNLLGNLRTICYLDDVLITGWNDDEHLKTLEMVFTSLEDYGLR